MFRIFTFISYCPLHYITIAQKMTIKIQLMARRNWKRKQQAEAKNGEFLSRQKTKEQILFDVSLKYLQLFFACVGVGKNWKIANVEAQIESLCEHSLKETFICTLRMNALSEHVVQFCLLFFPFLSSASVY